MTSDEIFAEWQTDVNIDVSELSYEAGRIPFLQHKYYKLYTAEKRILEKIKDQAKILKLNKHEFYTQGPSEETPKDWELPAVGKILRSDIQLYLDADKQMIEMNKALFYQSEKVELLKEIIESINKRGYLIRDMVTFEKWKSGG